MTFANPITLSELRTAFDAKTATITANKKLGQKDNQIPLRLASLASGASLLSRSIAFTMTDDSALQSIFVRVTDTTASRTIVATLSVDSGETKFLGDATVTATVVTINGTADGRTDFRTTTGTRLRLLKGVRYRLSVENTTSGTTGIITAGVQLRSVRRGGAGGPALVPCAFHNLGNFDVDKINANLQIISDDIEDSTDQRYTYSRCIYSLAGITDTDTAVLRQFAIRRPGASKAVEIVSVELALTNSTTGATWTLSKVGDTTYPTLSAAGGGVDVEVYASSGVSTSVASEATDTVLQIAADTTTGKTITAGYIVVHTRCDRANQNDTLGPYEPTFLDSTTSTAQSVIQSEFDEIADVVADDTAADKDVRCDVFVTRSLAAAASVVFRTQSGVRKLLRVEGYVVADNTETVTFTVASTSTTTVTFDVVGGTTSTRTVGGSDPGADATMADDPQTASTDLTITMADAGVATALLAYVVVWWR